MVKINKLIIFSIISLLLISFVVASSLYFEKQQARSEILRNYLDGKITQEQGVQQLKELSCEIAERSGAKYNKEICNGN